MRLVRLLGVFPPHSDSWLLADHVSKEIVPDGGRVLDVCTGSGLLAVIAAQKGNVEVVAIDASLRAVITARINARLNGAQIRAIRGDLFGPARGQRFDLIVSNPPYLPSRGRPRPHSAALAWDAGPSGRALLDRICGEVAAHLRPGGVLLLVQSSVSGEQETVRALTAAGLQTAVIDRRPGPLGPRLRARAAELRDRGLLREDGWEEMLVIRAVSSDSGGS